MDVSHDFIAFHAWGTLPQDKDRMLARLDKAIEEYRTKQDVVSDRKSVV